MSKAERKVFITHHFDERGRSYAALLAWILSRNGITSVTGETFVGRQSVNVQGLIRESRLLIAVLTRDVEVGGGGYQPSQWCIEEVIWALAHRVPCIIAVEEGVEYDGRLAGDLAQIRFTPDDLATMLERVVNQATALLGDVVIAPELPEDELSDPVWRLIVKGRDEGNKGNNENLLRLSRQALELNPNAWRAALNVGVAYVRLGQLNDAERVLSGIVNGFDDNSQAKALAYHNLGWREQVKSAGDPYNVESLQKEEEFYEAALALVHSLTLTRAALIQCRVLLGKLSEASLLLMQSLSYSGFLAALHHETRNRGHLGHQILRQLPESEWLYPLLFPVWQAADEGPREHDRLA